MPDAPALISSGLTDDERDTLKKLREQLRAKEKRNRLRSAYYDGKHRLRNMGISIPPSMQDIETVVGWPAKSVDVLEQRLELDGFVRPNQSEADQGISEAWADNDMDLEASQAHVSALTHGTAFVFVTKGEADSDDPDVVISPRSARQATAIANRRKRRIESALEVITGEKGSDRYVVLHLPGTSITLERNGREWSVEHRSGHSMRRVPCVPLVHRPFIERTFGMSRITRPVMSLTDTAVRTALRTEVSAEFYSSPQRYLLGADEEAFQDKDGRVKTGWETILGRMLAIPHPEPDENGERPPEMRVGQFAQASMQPHTEHLRSVAMMFSGETAIPVSYLGVIHDNPASADAIRAGEAELVKVAERAQLTFGAGWSTVGQLVVMVRDGLDEVPDDLSRLRPKWRDASTPTRQAMAQSVMSLVSVGVLPPDAEVTYEQLGLDQTTIERLMAEKRRREAAAALDRLTGAAASAVMSPEEMKARADAMGVLIRAGVSTESAARQVGLEGIEFTGAIPVSLRVPDSQASQLED